MSISPVNDQRSFVLFWELLGVIPIALAGAMLHFAFEWSGEWRPLAVFAAVNESVWEHMKLAFWPAVAWALLGRCLRPDATLCYWFAKSLGLLMMPLVMGGLFYAYTAALGRNLLWADITIFVVAIFVGQATAAGLLLYLHKTGFRVVAGGFLLAVQLVAFSLFTYMPPHMPIFEETRSGVYGIPP